MRTTTACNETYNSSEFNYNEWGDTGLDLNYFEARYYDPVLGRFHAPDPSTKLLVGAQRKLRDLSLGSAENQQFHSPYMANFDNPANHIDPDGRLSIDRETAKQVVGMILFEVGRVAAYCGLDGISGGAQFLANLGGIFSATSSYSGGGMAQLTQSKTVKNDTAQRQSPRQTQTTAAGSQSTATANGAASDDYGIPRELTRRLRQFKRAYDKAIEEGLTQRNALRAADLALGTDRLVVEQKVNNSQQGEGYRYFDVRAVFQSTQPRVAGAPIPQPPVPLVPVVNVMGPTFDDSFYSFNGAGPGATPVSITVTNIRAAGDNTTNTDMTITARFAGGAGPPQNLANGVNLRPGTTNVYNVPANSIGIAISYNIRSQVLAPGEIQNAIIAMLNFNLPAPPLSATPNSIFEASKMTKAQALNQLTNENRQWH